MRWDRMIKNIDVDDMLGAMGLCRSSQAGGVGGFFFGIGVGMLAGAGAALLLAPYTGSETREKLVKAGEDIGHTVATRVDEIRRNLQGTEEQSSLPSSGISSSTGYSNTRIGM